MNESDEMTWDLRDLFAGIDDPRIPELVEGCLQRACDFEARYRGPISSPDLRAGLLLTALREYEALNQDRAKPVTYAGLIFSADTSDPRNGAFLQQMRERFTQASLHLLFFELALMERPDESMDPLLADPCLAPYVHYLHTVRAARHHRLSEPEEKVLAETANTGRRAFTRLFDELTSNMQFSVTAGGATENLTQSQVLARLHEPDRDTRRTAAEALTQALERESRSLTLIHNTLLQDKAVTDRLRGYAYPEEARHLSNEMDRETVELVAQTCEAHYPLVARYYRLKRQILGYDQLAHYDRYAPLFQATQVVEYARAKDLVLAAFRDFSPLVEAAACEFFTRRWIDAQPRPGKSGGAFCSPGTPDLHPYVLLNFLNRPADVMTLAHELGHGIHASLARRQSYLNFDATLPIAELASTFAEMLVFERLQAAAPLQEKLALLADKIEGAFATIFRQAAMFRFEQRIHRMRREQGELSVAAISDAWQECVQTMFGDSVALEEGHRCWWMYIPHFLHAPFYVYAYSVGELLVMGLYRRYQEAGPAFVDGYLDVIGAGGSQSPAELMRRLAIDLRDPQFWQGGMSVLSGLVDQFEELYREWEAQSGTSLTASSAR